MKKSEFPSYNGSVCISGSAGALGCIITGRESVLRTPADLKKNQGIWVRSGCVSPPGFDRMCVC